MLRWCLEKNHKTKMNHKTKNEPKKKVFVFFEKAKEPTFRWPLPIPIQLLLSASHNLTCVQNVTPKLRNKCYGHVNA